jgi:hypothetical protein
MQHVTRFIKRKQRDVTSFVSNLVNKCNDGSNDSSKLHHGSCITDLASRILHHGSCITDLASRILHHGSCIADLASRILHHGSCITRSRIRDARVAARSVIDLRYLIILLLCARYRVTTNDVIFVNKNMHGIVVFKKYLEVI